MSHDYHHKRQSNSNNNFDNFKNNSQIEGLISVWIERKKSGGEYRSGGKNKHVIVCSSFLSQASVMDFLTEFYAHPKLEVSQLCPYISYYQRKNIEY